MSKTYTVLGAIVNKILEYIPDKNTRTKEAAEILKTKVDGEIEAASEQRKINLEEASKNSIFISGWRPAVCWVSLGVLLYGYFLEPWIIFIVEKYYPEHLDKLPTFDMEQVLSVMRTLLGLGG